MSVRVKAYGDMGRYVNVTLRKPVVDLTDVDLSVPAYTHINSRTVSGRLEWCDVDNEYVFLTK